MENLYSTKLKRCLSVYFVGWWVPVQRFHEDSLNLEALWISNILIHPVLQNHLQLKKKKSLLSASKSCFNSFNSFSHLLSLPISQTSTLRKITGNLHNRCSFLELFSQTERAAGEGCLPWFQHYSWLASEENHADGQNDSPAFGEWVALLSGPLWSISLLLPLSVLTIPSSKGHAEWSEEWHLHQTTSAFTLKSKLQWHLNCTALSWIPSSPVSLH